MIPYVEYTGKEKGQHRFAVQALTREDVLLIRFALKQTCKILEDKQLPLDEQTLNGIEYFHKMAARAELFDEIFEANIENDPTLMRLCDIHNLQELQRQKEQIKAYIMQPTNFAPLPDYLRKNLARYHEMLLNEALQNIDKQISRIETPPAHNTTRN